MRTEIYINGSLVDLDKESVIAATYGNVSFGDMSTRKGIKTNSVNLPLTNRNKLILESPELVGSDTNIPYTRSPIRFDIDGVPVFEGFCTIKKSQNNFQIQCFAGASDFYSVINTKKLVELDLERFDHTWSEESIRASWNRTDGYIYPWVDYGLTWNPSGNLVPILINPDYLVPSMFFHTVIKQIAADQGYTLQGDVISDENFLKHLILYNKFPTPIAYGGSWDMASLLPDITQSKLWLDFASIYGLQFEVDDVQGIIYCDYIDDILFSDPEDWTDKVDRSENPAIEYRFDNYGQTSQIKYKTTTNDIFQSPGYVSVGAIKEVLINDINLPLNKTIYESQFHLMDVTTLFTTEWKAVMITEAADADFLGVWDSARNYTVSTSDFVWWNGSYYRPISAGTNHEPPNSTYWVNVPKEKVFRYGVRNMYGMLEIVGVTNVTVAFSPTRTVNRFVTGVGLQWTDIYQKRYRLFNRIINKTKRVQMLMRLNYADVNQIDFTTAKKIDGELYVLEEITQYKINERDSTNVQLIRI